jgi:hypothetical protein
MLDVVMLSVIYTECSKEALNTECHYAECCDTISTHASLLQSKLNHNFNAQNSIFNIIS